MSKKAYVMLVFHERGEEVEDMQHLTSNQNIV